MNKIEFLLKRNGIKLKHKLDQHFIADRSIIRQTVSFAAIKPGDTVLEIGPGLGFLTEEITKKASRTIAVEMDKTLASFLRHKFRGNKRVEIIIGNGLNIMDNIEFDRIVSYIPYSISEALVQKLFFRDFKSAVFSVPKGFAYKLISPAPEKSKLSLMCNVFLKAEIKKEIPKNTFYPIPATNSIIINLKPCENSIQKQFFSMRKKIVKNALVESLCRAHGMTKNKAKETIKSLKTNKILLENRVESIDFKQSIQILELLKQVKT